MYLALSFIAEIVLHQPAQTYPSFLSVCSLLVFECQVGFIHSSLLTDTRLFSVFATVNRAMWSITPWALLDHALAHVCRDTGQKEP